MMFKSLSLLLFAGWLSIGSTMQTSGVYICDSKDAKKFHLVEITGITIVIDKTTCKLP